MTGELFVTLIDRFRAWKGQKHAQLSTLQDHTHHTTHKQHQRRRSIRQTTQENLSKNTSTPSGQRNNPLHHEPRCAPAPSTSTPATQSSSKRALATKVAAAPVTVVPPSATRPSVVSARPGVGGLLRNQVVVGGSVGGLRWFSALQGRSVDLVNFTIVVRAIAEMAHC